MGRILIVLIIGVLVLTACDGNTPKQTKEKDPMFKEIEVKPIEVEKIEVETILTEDILTEEIITENIITWDNADVTTWD